MHPILPFPGIYWNMNFSRSSWFRPLIVTPVRAIWFNIPASIRTRWWSIPKSIPSCAESFPSVKEVAFDWFYSLLQRSVHSFEALTKLFLTQCSSLQEFKQSNHHLLSVKIRFFDNLKTYVGYFQNQLVKVHNCSKDASALAFISVLRITHPLYKHLVKYNITCWSEILYRAQWLEFMFASFYTTSPCFMIIKWDFYCFSLLFFRSII